MTKKSSHEKALQEQVDYLTKKLFGSSSERRSDDIPGQQNLFDEAEVEQDPSLLEEETVIKEHTRKRKATHEDLFKGLNVEKVVIPLPEEEQICPVCGTQMVLIGEEYVRRELEFIPATCKVIEYYSQSYGCPSCKEGFGDTVERCVAERLREVSPDVVVVFITGYEQYALEALKIRADYYLTKPYDSRDIREVLERARLLSARQKKRVYVRTFGRFDVFIDGTAVYFPNAKAKELLALCVDHRGGTVSIEEAVDKLWEDREYDSRVKNLYRKAVMQIRQALAGVRRGGYFFRQPGLLSDRYSESGLRLL